MRALGLTMILALLAGCAGTLSPRTEADEVAALLDQFHRLAAAPAEEQRQAVATAQTALERADGELPRLRLALLLALPQAAGRDEARIVALLAPLDQPATEEPSPRRSLAALLARQARQALDRQRAARDEQRHLETALREERRRTQEFQQKLEALRSIDRDLRRRPGSR